MNMAKGYPTCASAEKNTHIWAAREVGSMLVPQAWQQRWNTESL
jgi:hypothetical protein